MHTTNLRKVGGSVMLAVPPPLLNVLRLRPGAKVGVSVEKGRLIVDAHPRPRYTLNELLVQCNPRAKRTREEWAWLRGKAAGRELI